MSIKRGYSEKIIRENIADLIRNKYTRSQAVAIAYHSARDDWHEKHGNAPYPEHLVYMKANPAKAATNKVLLKDVKAAEREYANRVSTYGEHDMGAQRALVKWYELRQAYEEKTGKPLYSMKRNPAPSKKTQIEQASKLYRKFSGHEPEYVSSVKKPAMPDVGLVIGPLEGVAYEATRDGKTEKYFHRFTKKSRPLLVSSQDGRSIHIVGGRYDFTEDGIVDSK